MNGDFPGVFVVRSLSIAVIGVGRMHYCGSDIFHICPVKFPHRAMVGWSFRPSFTMSRHFAFPVKSVRKVEYAPSSDGEIDHI